MDMNCIRIKDLEKKIGLKKSKIYELINRGLLPKPFKVGKASLWIDAEIEKAIKENLIGCEV